VSIDCSQSLEKKHPPSLPPSHPYLPLPRFGVHKLHLPPLPIHQHQVIAIQHPFLPPSLLPSLLPSLPASAAAAAAAVQIRAAAAGAVALCLTTTTAAAAALLGFLAVSLEERREGGREGGREGVFV